MKIHKTLATTVAFFALLYPKPARSADEPSYRIFALESSYATLRQAMVGDYPERAKYFPVTGKSNSVDVLPPAGLAMMLRGTVTAKLLPDTESPLHVAVTGRLGGFVDLDLLYPAGDAETAKRSFTLEPKHSLLVAIPDKAQAEGFRLLIVTPN